MSPASAAPQPLAGCRVLDLTTLLPGPWATSQLAAFGAEVIKIEPPGGDPVRTMNPAFFGVLHRGKQSVVLDLREPAGRESLLQLVAQADVLIEGMRPGVLARQGLDVATLHAANPRLVVCSMSAFGWTGPYRDRGGHDLGLLAMAGYFAIPSQLDGATTRPQVRVADLVAGQSAAFAVVMAWLQARATGQGSHVDASLFDATCAWTAPALLTTPPFEDPAELGLVMADSALYRTADGRQLAVATLEDKFWRGLVQAAADVAPELGAAAWATRRGRDADKRALAAALARAIAQLPLADWQQRLAAVDTTVETVWNRDEALVDPQLLARGLVLRDGGDGAGPALRYPAFFDGVAPAVLGPAPALDEHRAAWLPMADKHND